jgi:threonine synthase
MGTFSGYRCTLCGAEYPPRQPIYTCPADGGNLNVLLDLRQVRRQLGADQLPLEGEPSLWRYLPLLPVDDPGGRGTALRLAGWTPVLEPVRLAAELGLRRLWVKDESRNPSASFKDRASAVLMARARQIKAEVVVTASTGNAGAALACMAAALGSKAVIFAPRQAPPAKVAQLLVFGATVLLVDGNYNDAIELSLQASTAFGWYCRNTGYNPFTAEGKKTAAFEIWDWRRRLSPDFELSQLKLFVPVGDGNIISGIHKGFKDLQALGWIAAPPQLIGVQAEGSAAIANAYLRQTEQIAPVQAHTIADSISVDLPRDGVRAVRAAVQTGGRYVLVSDAEILAGIAQLGKAGVFAEPAGAAAYAGLVKARREGWIGSDDPVLVLNTGSGLKDVRAAMQAVKEAPIIEPSLAALKRMIQSTNLHDTT